MATGFEGIDVIPVRTPTLPPATHTNVWVLGQGALTVVDPASPWEDEQQRLLAELSRRTDAGERIERLFLTHHHLDHVSGAVDLQQRLASRGTHVPIAAHRETATLVADHIEVDVFIEDLEEMECGGSRFTAHHTPGHAPGHLVLHHAQTGAVIAGDLVAGVGTIAIDPREGDLQQYIDSLEHVKTLEPSALMPAHGPILEHAETVLSFYVAHRNGRSDQIRAALVAGGDATPSELVPSIYPDLDAAFHPVGAAQILTHLLWLQGQGLADTTAAGHWRAE